MHLVTLARGAAHKLAKDGGEDDDAAADDHEVAAAAEQLDYEPLRAEVLPPLKAVAADAAHLGLEQVDRDLDALLSQANARAIEWAEERAGEMVTQVSKTTRETVADLTARALDEGWSNAELADALDSADVFGDARAEMIARTETAMADVQGNLIGWKESGVVASKEWIVADENECDDCAALHGVVVPLDEEFDEGGPPLHPNCRCDVLPVLSEQDESSE